MSTSVKIFKKSAPNGKLFLYLGQREYISCNGKIDDIRGVANLPDLQSLNGKFVYASLVCSFRHGREEDEVMGISFAKELVVDRTQVYPNTDCKDKDKLQTKLCQKLGDSARPFQLGFPKTSPNSVMIKGDDGDSSSMGVSFEVRLHIGENKDDFKGTKKGSVAMIIRKSQWAPADNKSKSPFGVSDKGFLCSSGKISLEVRLDKGIMYHGQEIPIHISISNDSSKCVKSVWLGIIQHCELTMVGAQYTCKVATLETKDGCPLEPGANMNKTITLKPLAQIVANGRGLALDGTLSKVKDESNLASSTLVENGNTDDLLGVVVSYSVNVKLHLSGMGGELEVDVPFKLLHPLPDSEEMMKLEELRKINAEEAVRNNKRRQKFQAQDSVLVEALGNSLEE